MKVLDKVLHKIFLILSVLILSVIPLTYTCACGHEKPIVYTYPTKQEKKDGLIPMQDILKIQSKAKLIHSEQEVNAAIRKMATKITAKLKDTNPIILPVMNGGLIPAGKLIPLLNFPLQIDYLQFTRYNNTTKGGELKVDKEPKLSLKGRTVLIVDDILDKGITLQAVVDYCKAQGAKAVYTAVIANKATPKAPNVATEADFTGLVVEDLYLFGVGMDYKGYFRNINGIWAIPQD